MSFETTQEPIYMIYHGDDLSDTIMSSKMTVAIMLS